MSGQEIIALTVSTLLTGGIGVISYFLKSTIDRLRPTFRSLPLRYAVMRAI